MNGKIGQIMYDNYIRQLVHVFAGAELQLEIIWIYSQTAKFCQKLYKTVVGNTRNFRALSREINTHIPLPIVPEGVYLVVSTH